jgi:hypothetical protein
LKEALAILKEHHKRKLRAQLLAGGTDMLVQMRTANREPRTIVDVKRLDETNRLTYDAKKTFVGAAIPGVVLCGEKKLIARHPGRSHRPHRLSDPGARRWQPVCITCWRHDPGAHRQRGRLCDCLAARQTGLAGGRFRRRCRPQCAQGR